MGHRAIRKGEAKGKLKKKEQTPRRKTTEKSIRDRWWNREPDTVLQQCCNNSLCKILCKAASV